MIFRFPAATLTVAVLSISLHANAQEAAPAGLPPAMISLIACRAIPAASDRLACFDRAAQNVQTGLSSGELLVVDRTQASAARRQAFGTATAPADILQPPRSEDRIDSIETTLVRAIQSADESWTFVLADGSTWKQTDAEQIYIRNREGEPVRVRRAALGTYLLVVGNSRALRVRRQ